MYLFVDPKHYAFLDYVKNYLEKFPDLAPSVYLSISEGIEEALSVQRIAKCNAETALLAALSNSS